MSKDVFVMKFGIDIDNNGWILECPEEHLETLKGRRQTFKKDLIKNLPEEIGFYSAIVSLSKDNNFEVGDISKVEGNDKEKVEKLEKKVAHFKFKIGKIQECLDSAIKNMHRGMLADVNDSLVDAYNICKSLLEKRGRV